jgi:hypothetical protein
MVEMAVPNPAARMRAPVRGDWAETSRHDYRGKPASDVEIGEALHPNTWHPENAMRDADAKR